VIHEAARLTVYPIATVIFFLGMSFACTGEWFVTGGFYVPDPKLQGQAPAVYQAIRDGLIDLAGSRFVTAMTWAIPILAIAALLKRNWSGLLMPIALAASIALPFYAFFSGHPFRIRYEVPLILAGAACIGAAVSLLRFAAPLVAIPLLFGVILQASPFDPDAPMIVEAQLDKNVAGRRAVTACLQRDYDGTTIMASMGSLAHYMQELSHEGLQIADFIHEGNGAIWDLALTAPATHAGWMLIEEQSEGGDVLARRVHEDAAFTRGMERVCSGGGVALYRTR